MELVSFTPEGKIVLTLKHGRHTYSELRLETGLSDRWLAIKLGELEVEGVVEKNGRWYGLKQETCVSVYELSLYMVSQAKRIAGELANLRFVEAVILFGSVARKNATEFSDLDMLIVVGGPYDRVKGEVVLEVSRLELSYHIPIEALILSEKDFLDNVRSREGGIIFGVAEGFEVLVDKTGELGEILRNRVEKIRRSHDYLVDERIWLKVR
jgi:predicted nucleotidyltransferase